VGETFSGVPFDTGVRAARSLAAIAEDLGVSTAALALRWVIDQPGVSVVIPGARNAEQARANSAAAQLPPLSDETLRAIERIYDDQIREHVHDRW
jgi:aryl-alcohol dehydrogenase-like predicted oxidoreductase